MLILRGLFLFASFYSFSISFGAESPITFQSASVSTKFVTLPQQFKEDLAEVQALCWMRFSLNKALLSTDRDPGYLLRVKNDMDIYVKANKILNLINISSSGISSNIDKLNRGFIDRLYRQISINVQTRTDQERMEKIAYNDLFKEKKKERGRRPLMDSLAEIVNELPPLRQIKDILGRYASRHEIELARFLESDVTCTLAKINGKKIIEELDKVTNLFVSVLNTDDISVQPKCSKPSVGLRDRLAFEKAHPKFPHTTGIALPKTPSDQESKIDAPKIDGLIEGIKLLCALNDFMKDRAILEKGSILKILETREVHQDLFSAFKGRLEKLLKTINGINFDNSTLDKDINEIFVKNLMIIKDASNQIRFRIQLLSIADTVLPVIEALEKKELKSLAVDPVDKIISAEEEAAPTLLSPPVVASVPKAEATVAKPMEERAEPLSSLASEPEEKGVRASDKAKKKKAKEELLPLGYQERSPAEAERVRKEKLISMVRDLSQKPRKSLRFREIRQAVNKLGGTIQTNGTDSHYTIRLRHIETGHLVLGATLNKEATSGEYPWWLDTAVDALERATGLITEDMSRYLSKNP